MDIASPVFLHAPLPLPFPSRAFPAARLRSDRLGGARAMRRAVDGGGRLGDACCVFEVLLRARRYSQRTRLRAPLVTGEGRL